MLNLKSIESQLAGVEQIVTGRRGFQLGSAFFFADCYLVLHFDAGLLAVDWTWAKHHIGLSGAVAIAFLFYLYAGVLLPWIHFFLVLPSLVGSELLLKKWAKGDLEFIQGARQNYLLNFAMLENNNIVYQEYLRQKQESDQITAEMQWSFTFFVSLALAVLASRAGPDTLVGSAWDALALLPVWMFYPTVVALAVSIAVQFLASLLYFRFMGKFHMVSPMLYQKLERMMLPLEVDDEEEEEQDDS